MQNCCEPNNNQKSIKHGLLYGLMPHTFCILFVFFSIIGATGATTLAKQFLIIPHFFLFLFIISFLCATLSAIIYLKKNNCHSLTKIKNKWKYLLTLYSVTIATNILIIFVIFPVVANIQPARAMSQESQLTTGYITVEIPCPGHAPLIIDEIKKDIGVSVVKFSLPNTFAITYDSTKTSLEKITTLEIFKTFKTKIKAE